MSAPSKRELVKQALQVTGWMLKAIEAPKDLQHWPRRDREAWFDVVGRPRLREVMAQLQAQSKEEADAPVAPEGMTIEPEDTLRVPLKKPPLSMSMRQVVDGDMSVPNGWAHIEERAAFESVVVFPPLEAE